MRHRRSEGEQPGRRRRSRASSASRSSPSGSRRRARTIPRSPRSRIDQQYAAAGGIAGVRVLDATTLELELTRAVPADPLLVRDGVHDAGALGGDRLLRRPGRPRRLRRASRRHGPVPARRLRQAAAASCSSATRTGTASAIRSGARPGRCIPSDGEPGDAEQGCSIPRTSGSRCRSSSASSSGSTRRTSPRSRSSCRATTTRPASSRRASTASCTRAALSPDMAALGMRLEKAVMPSIYYLGFNMNDPVVGDAGRRARPEAPPGDEPRHRQPGVHRASSRTAAAFRRSRSLPPGLFGYDAELRESRIRQGRPRARDGAARARPAIRAASIRRRAGRST